MFRISVLMMLVLHGVSPLWFLRRGTHFLHEAEPSIQVLDRPYTSITLYSHYFILNSKKSINFRRHMYKGVSRSLYLDIGTVCLR